MEVHGHAIEGSVLRYPAMVDFGPVELGRNPTEQVFIKIETSAAFHPQKQYLLNRLSLFRRHFH